MGMTYGRQARYSMVRLLAFHHYVHSDPDAVVIKLSGCPVPREGHHMADDDDLPDIERATGEEAPAPDELLTGDIADAWHEEFDEDLTWGDLARWLGEAG
jgi:hypothetical protein